MKTTENMSHVDKVEQGQQGTQRREQAERLQRGPVVTPPVDIYENDNEVLLLADLPGVLPDGLNVELDEDQLTVEGRRAWKLQGEPDAQLIYRRSFTVSPNIDSTKVEAKLEGGVLRVHLPKHPAAKKRRIPIGQG